MNQQTRLALSALSLCLSITGCGLLSAETPASSPASQLALPAPSLEQLVGKWERVGQITFEGSSSEDQIARYVNSLFTPNFEVMRDGTCRMLSTSGQFEDGVFIILPERKITCLSVQSGTSVIVSIHAIDNDRLMLYLDDLSVLGFSIPVGYLYKRAQP